MIKRAYQPSLAFFEGSHEWLSRQRCMRDGWQQGCARLVKLMEECIDELGPRFFDRVEDAHCEACYARVWQCWSQAWKELAALNADRQADEVEALQLVRGEGGPYAPSHFKHDLVRDAIVSWAALQGQSKAIKFIHDHFYPLVKERLRGSLRPGEDSWWSETLTLQLGFEPDKRAKSQNKVLSAKLAEFRALGGLETWLTECARRNIRDRRRQKTLQHLGTADERIADVESDGLLEFDDLDERDVNCMDRLKKELDQVLIRLVRQDDKRRQWLVSYILQGESWRQIGRASSLHPVTVQRFVDKAMQEITDHIAKLQDQPALSECVEQLHLPEMRALLKSLVPNDGEGTS